MIGIIDYGMSNLHSVKNACDYLNLDSVVSKDVSVLSKCDKFFIGDVIREKYNDKYKIDGDGSIILEH